MTIIVNGNSKVFQDGATLLEILKELDLVDKVMAAAVNMEIVKQNDWDKKVLKDNDKLELLDFVGGG
ncbi:sulfur carrier protein ThiS [Sulfurimonas sp. NW15]|uniref:sulfur carrier protein ThiS n=1 Tax=Sulfurimonas TaxID=202746 RepID=UPI00125FD6CC|nr:sulfur carrier protein ThiS [Sulfurimonas hydrogeniphila]